MPNYPTPSNYVPGPVQDGAGVAAGVTFVLILLFFLFSLGVVADFGVLSDFVSFLSSNFVFIVGPFMAPIPVDAAAWGGGTGLRPVDERWNSPGRPVIGFSSKYSPPCLMCIMNDSSAALSSDSSSVLEAAGVAF